MTGEDLRRAIDAVLAGKPAPAEQYPRMGLEVAPGQRPGIRLIRLRPRGR